MAKKELVEFILEARRRGFSNAEIRDPLLEKGWVAKDIKDAFKSADNVEESKIRITVSLPKSVMKILEKRADKNLMSVEAQIEDIVRRSAATGKTRAYRAPEKIDDVLVSVFSRVKRKR